jgi:hypothetical protein
MRRDDTDGPPPSLMAAAEASKRYSPRLEAPDHFMPSQKTHQSSHWLQRPVENSGERRGTFGQ